MKKLNFSILPKTRILQTEHHSNRTWRSQLHSRTSPKFLHQRSSVHHASRYFQVVFVRHSVFFQQKNVFLADLADYLYSLLGNESLYLKYFEWRRHYRVHRFLKFLLTLEISCSCPVCEISKQIPLHIHGYTSHPITWIYKCFIFTSFTSVPDPCHLCEKVIWIERVVGVGDSFGKSSVIICVIKK